MTGRICHTRRTDDGAAAVEFALVLIPMLMLLIGIIQYSMYFYSGQSGAAAAHDAARRAAVGDMTCAELTTSTTSKTHLKNSSTPGLSVTRTYYAPGTSTVRSASTIQTGDDIKVVVQYNSVDLDLPFIPLPNGGVIREEAFARLENKDSEVDSMLRFATRRDDRGAVAVLFALLAIVLFAAGAFAVDLGNAYQRQRTVQSQADLSATAAAAKLPNQAAVVAEACRNATLNRRIGQDKPTLTCTSSTSAIDKPACPASVTAGRSAHVFFFSTNRYKVKVCSPGATVSYGLARAIPGIGESIDVRASATVAAGSPGASSEMPYYGVAGSGCDYGSQALTDPAKGHTVSSGFPTNLAVPTSGTPKQSITLTAITPAQIPLSTTSTVRITGSGLSKVTAVGFYRETTYTPNKVEPTLVATSDSTGKTVDYTIPATSPLVAQEGVWYVRVYETGSNPSQTGWSKDALVLRVGDPVITCDSLSNAGNFGSLKLPRTDSSNSTSNGWMPNNIADGLQAPLSLAVHTQAASPWTCVSGGTGVVYSTVTGTPVLRPQTNCVDTDTGLTANATTAGLITGTPLFPGRLTKAPTSTGILGGRNCAPNKSSTSRSVLSKTINNDILSCYITDPNMKIDAFAKASYTGGAVLDASIYQSPRFCYVPIFNTDPTKGGSATYSIIDVRPCFITSEANTSSWNNTSFRDGTASTTQNGVTVVSGKVETLGVVFFNRNALPNASSSSDLGDYIGVGPMAVQMVD